VKPIIHALFKAKEERACRLPQLEDCRVIDVRAINLNSGRSIRGLEDFPCSIGFS